MDDNELMAAVISGEIGKLGILYEKYKKPLYAYFMKLTAGDIHASEDLVHTVFFRVIRYKSGFRCEGSFASWLFSIAHNAGIDYNRKIKRMIEYKSYYLVTHMNHYEPGELEHREEQRTLEMAMSKLKREERELLTLSKIDNLKYREIAGILKTTESNIKIKIFRALRKLKDIYLTIENNGYEKERT